MKSNTQLVRLDTNLAANIDAFSQFGNDGELMKTLLIYAAFKEQSSLFRNLGTLDIKETAKDLGLGYGRLSNAHPNPVHLQRIKLECGKDQSLLSARLNAKQLDIKEKVFSSVLENALYRLTVENIAFTGGYRCYQHDGEEMKSITLKSIRFFTDVSPRHIKTAKGQTKIVYDYKLSDEFMNNFSLFYKYLDLTMYLKLRKKNLEDLYIFLCNMLDILASSNQTSTETVTLQKLLSLAKINFSSQPNAQTSAQRTQAIRNAKRQLNLKFKQLEEISNIGVTLSWKKTNKQTHPYTPVITFDPSSRFIPDPKEARKGFMRDAFCKQVMELITTQFPTLLFTEHNAIPSIVKYFNSDRVDVKEIELIFINAHIETFKEPPLKFLSFQSRVWPYLQTCKTLNDISQALQGLNPNERYGIDKAPTR